MTASLAPLIPAGSTDNLGVSNAGAGGLDNNLNVSSFEETRHYEQTTTR